MRIIGVAIATVCCVTLLWAAGPAPWSVGWAAPAPSPEVGTYEVKNCEVNKRPSEPCRKSWEGEFLHIIDDHTYWWGGFHAPYQITDGGNGIKLDCWTDWNSNLSLRDKKIKFWWIEKQPKPPDKSFDLWLEGGKLALPTASLPPLSPCGRLQGTPGIDPRIATNRRLPVRPGLYAQVPEPRTVDGELLLTVRTRTDMGPDKPPATAEDIRLWDCLITNGYPRVEFIDTNTQEHQRAFVWPDGRFRAQLRPGVSYDWSLLPTDCGTPGQPAGSSGRFKLDRLDPATTTEKVLLSCFVFKNRGFTDCKGWWLVHP